MKVSHITIYPVKNGFRLEVLRHESGNMPEMDEYVAFTSYDVVDVLDEIFAEPEPAYSPTPFQYQNDLVDRRS